MAEIRTLKLNLLADIDQFTRGMKGARGDVDSLAYKLGEFSKTALKAFAVVTAAAAVFGAKLAKDSIKAASDLNETITKTQVIFGDASKEIIAFSNTAAKSLGLSRKSALDAASTFAVFGKSAGLTGKDLTKFSTDLTKLSADFASFFNTRPEDAITAIGAALRGESEPIRRYGVLLNDATLKAEALKMGLYDGKGALDVQARSLAAYQVILNQTKDAQGDFARTSEGLANQQRILNASWENAKATLGEAFLPIAVKFVTYLNDVLIPVIQEVANGFVGKDPYSGLNGKIKVVAKAMDDPTDTAGYSLGQSLRNVFNAFSNLITVLTSGDATTGISTLDKMANSLQTIANAIDSITNAWARFSAGTKNIEGPKFADSSLGKLLGWERRAAGGTVTAGQAYRVGEFGPEMFVPNASGRIVPNAGGGNVTINLNGIIDAESARRSIEKLLQDSARRTGAINLVGATL